MGDEARQGTYAAQVPVGFPEQAPRVIVGGIVAHNDERWIDRSVRSLLSQELPPGSQWGRIWVVASGCTDRTIDIAHVLASEDPRLGIVVEPERRGKASALREVLRRAEGDALVLLNSDAEAARGSVAVLLAKAEGKPRPFAVMARPVVPTEANGRWSGTMRWMWDLHHELHRELLEDGRGAHLSDELLLVSLPPFPWIEEGVINDGSYCAVWLQTHSGGCWYAPEARVIIDIPTTPRDHLRQRRRIHVGNAQVARRLGRRPTTAFRYLWENPPRALRALRRTVTQPQGMRNLLTVLGWESVAHALASWDRLPPRRDHVRWSRITAPLELGSPSPTLGSSVAESERALAHRVRVLLDVAQEFRTGVPLPRLAELLPHSLRGAENQLESFLTGRPALAQLANGNAYPPGPRPPLDEERVERGIRYHRAAERLVTGRLAWLRPWVRCIGVTGSAAYGSPAAGDDLDFYVVTRTGAASWFLLATYLTLRIRKDVKGDPPEPSPCFNYVVDDRRAPIEFARGHGLLFAREALTARLVLGDAYYRGLLRDAPWLGAEIPQLYGRRAVDPGETTPEPAPLIVRCLSALAFVPLAAHLQLAGLIRNARARREGRPSAVFRTLTTPDGFVFQSQRFEDLRHRYERPPDPHPSYITTGAPSRIPLLR